MALARTAWMTLGAHVELCLIPQIDSITTLEHAVVTDSKEARSNWVNAYVKPGVRCGASCLRTYIDRYACAILLRSCCIR